MTISNATVAGPYVQVPCIGGGFITTATMQCELDAAASHSLAPLIAAIGAPGTGRGIAIYDAGADVDMEDNGAGVSITPYLDFANQTLEYRRSDTGAVNATNAPVNGGNFAQFTFIVLT